MARWNPVSPLPASAALCLALAVTGTAVQAGTGLAFLRVGPGARAVAMGEAVTSNVNDPTATWWNPGAIALLDHRAFELGHIQSFEDVRFESGGLTWRMGRHGAGLALHGVWSDGIPRTDETGRDIGSFGYYGASMSGSYAFALSEQLGVGVGLELLREQIDTWSTDGLAVNFGAQWREAFPRTDLGLALLHLGSSLKYEEESFDLPVTVQGGISHRLPLGVTGGSVLFAAEVRSTRDEDTQLLIGSEYRYGEVASLDVGYRSALDTQDVSLGAGVHRGAVDAHYAFVPFSEELGEQHRLSLRVAF